MKINLSEIKIWGDVKSEFNNVLGFCIENWSDSSVKTSIEWNTFLGYKFIKKDLIDLKEIEMFDEILFEETVYKFLLSYMYKDSDSSNVRVDSIKLSMLSEEEINAMYVDNVTMTDSTKSVYYKSLKSYGFINNKGEIDVNILNKNSNIKKFYIKNSLEVIKKYGSDWNSNVFDSLIKLNIIQE